MSPVLENFHYRNTFFFCFVLFLFFDLLEAVVMAKAGTALGMWQWGMKKWQTRVQKSWDYVGYFLCTLLTSILQPEEDLAIFKCLKHWVPRQQGSWRECSFIQGCICCPKMALPSKMLMNKSAQISIFLKD